MAREIPKKIHPGPKVWNPPKIPPKYRKKKNPNGHFWYFGGMFSVFSGYFGGKFWESRISGRGVFLRYFSWKFQVGPSRGSVAGRGVLNFRTRFGSFVGSFFVFSNPFSYRIQFFGGGQLRSADVPP